MDKGSPGKARVEIRNINSYITCKLCRGYLVDAVSITECLHSFCKSCLLRHMEEDYHCPVCNTLIHQSHPHSYISTDRTLQEIVYKVVPNLKKREIVLREKFYRKRGISPPAYDELARPPQSSEMRHMNGVKHNNDLEATSMDRASGEESSPLKPPLHPQSYYMLKDQLNICLEPENESVPVINHKYLRLSSTATINHIQKFVALKLLHDMDLFKKIEISFHHQGQYTRLAKDHSLKFIAIMYWRLDDLPMPLCYSIKGSTAPTVTADLPSHSQLAFLDKDEEASVA